MEQVLLRYIEEIKQLYAVDDEEEGKSEGELEEEEKEESAINYFFYLFANIMFVCFAFFSILQ